jgi:chromosome segregation ATPase
MELYDFIRNDFSRLFRRNEGADEPVMQTEVNAPALDDQEDANAIRVREVEEAFANLQKDLEAALAEREMLQHRIVELESHFEEVSNNRDKLVLQLEEVKNNRDELVLQLQAAESDRNSVLQAERGFREKAETLAAEREDLLGRINTLENNIAELERAQNNLAIQMQAAASEKDKALSEAAALVTEKSSEIERLQNDILALQQEHQKTLATMGRIETEKQNYIIEIDRVRQDFSVSMKKSYIAIAIICIAALAAIVGLFFYYENGRMMGNKTAEVSIVQPGTGKGSSFDVERNLQASRSRATEEVVTALQKEVKSVAAQRKRLRVRMAALKGDLEKLNNKQNELVMKLQEVEYDKDNAVEAERQAREKLEALAAEREDLLGRINILENQIAMLKRER